LSYSSFEFYDEKTLQPKVVPGEYEIFYGSSSDPKDLKLAKISVL
jgi:beta-glucosidase